VPRPYYVALRLPKAAANPRLAGGFAYAVLWKVDPTNWRSWLIADFCSVAEALTAQG
jgi:hypothetical protein